MNHWNQHARQWHLIGEPLRPSAADIHQFASWITRIASTDSACFNVLLLGVTPELAAIDWPVNTRLFVVDASLDMIQCLLLPQKLALSPVVTVGNWLHLPYSAACMDLVIGDGCFSMVSQNNYDNLVNEIIRVLKPAGHCCMRFFTRPKVQESIDTIYADFTARKIDNFHILKWRIAMALQKQLTQGVCLHDIWEVWNRFFQHERQYFSWSEATANTINVYKNNPAIYTFPSLSELTTHLQKKFNPLEHYQPDYPLGERCPLFKLQSLMDP